MQNAKDLLDQIFYYMNELITEKDFEKTILLLTDLGRTLVDSERASFWYWDREKRQHWTLAATQSGKIVVPEGSGIVGASIVNGETILINDPYKDERFNPDVDKKTGYHTKSILCIPVTDSKGKVIGAYQAINKAQNGEGFDAEDIKRLSLAAVYCGKMLESQILSKESRTDRLTGLLNRTGFYEYYQSLKTAGFIIGDIDYFKKVNDVYGHNAGDAVLMHVAELMLQECRERGQVFRWGGEEFILMLPETDFTKTIEFAENIRKRIEEETCVFAGNTIHITMSFGVTVMQSGCNPEEVVKRADLCLYKAKADGRNKVVCEEGEL